MGGSPGRIPGARRDARRASATRRGGLKRDRTRTRGRSGRASGARGDRGRARSRRAPGARAKTPAVVGRFRDGASRLPAEEGRLKLPGGAGLSRGDRRARSSLAVARARGVCDTRTPRRAACVPATRSAPRGDAGTGELSFGHDGGRHARPGSAGTIRTANAVPRADWLSAFWKLKIFSWRLRRLATRLPRRRTVSDSPARGPARAPPGATTPSAHADMTALAEFRRLARGLAPGEARRRRDPPRGLHERAGHAQVRPVCRGGTRVTSPEARLFPSPDRPAPRRRRRPSPHRRANRDARRRLDRPARDPRAARRRSRARSPRAARPAAWKRVSWRTIDDPALRFPRSRSRPSPPLLSLTPPAEIPRRSPFAALRTRPPPVAPFCARAVATPTRTAVTAPAADVALPSMEDPWNDEKWKDVKWTVYRDVAYDMQPFVDKHPGGNWLLNLSLQRDCTALIESYHLRPEVSAARFRSLPRARGFPDGCGAQVAPPERLPAVQRDSRARSNRAVPERGEGASPHGRGRGGGDDPGHRGGGVRVVLQSSVVTGAMLGLAGRGSV